MGKIKSILLRADELGIELDDDTTVVELLKEIDDAS